MDPRVTRQGIVRNAKTGEYYIPATQRANGTWRKTRKVKQSYMPQDQVPAYKVRNRCTLWKRSEPNGPVGLAPTERKPASSVSHQKNYALPVNESAKKNQKPREKKKQQGSFDPVVDITNDIETVNIGKQEMEPHFLLPRAERAQKGHRLQSLLHKQRRIRRIRREIESGELPNPESGQLEEIASEDAIEKEIDDLQLQLYQFFTLLAKHVQ